MIFKKDNNFIDENIHQQLLASAKKYGDLRERVLSLDNVNYEVESFYTKAFGGIFILKSAFIPILIFEDKEAYNQAIQNTSHDVLMYHINHEELFEKLKSHLIVECDLNSMITKARYERIKKYMLYETLTEVNHSYADILEDSLLFKSYLNKLSIEDRKKVMSVDRYLEKKKEDAYVHIKTYVNDDLYWALHHPHSSLGSNEQDLVWNLLVTIAPKDILFLYWYDKQLFYQKYQTLQDSMKDWVIETINNAISR